VVVAATETLVNVVTSSLLSITDALSLSQMGMGTFSAVVFSSVWFDGEGMNHEITNTTELSTDQQQAPVDIIRDQYGPCLSFDDFTDYVLLLFEDISGFEAISDSESHTVINQLWSDYHGPDK